MALKTIQRNVATTRLIKGQAVVMDDGWRGKVLHDNGDSVVCLENGEAPNDWLRGYRAFGRSRVAIEGTKIKIHWSRATAAAPQCSLDAVLADHARARREREWQSIPEY